MQLAYCDPEVRHSIIMDSIDSFSIKPTSRDSASCSPIVLRQTTTTRLVFIPQLVNNVHNANAVVGGVFAFQKKKPTDKFENVDSINLAHLKGGEGVRLDLETAEVLALHRHLEGLYQFHLRSGIPGGPMTFHVVDPSALSTPLDTFLKLPDLNKTIDLPALSKFLSWLAKIDQAPEVIEKLQELDINSLQRLNVLAGVSVLKKALAIWEANEDNGDEEFWQKTLATNAFVFSQVFSFPVIVLEGKAYAGGKGIRNTGGGIADFLLANKLTRNTALVEIKTPATKLLGSEYRHGVFPPSQELAGGVIQVTNYRDSLTKEFYSLVRKSAEEFEAFTPPCLVIAGNSREVSDPDKKRCFELFRSGLKDVSIITYDELFAKVNALAALLEGVETG